MADSWPAFGLIGSAGAGGDVAGVGGGGGRGVDEERRPQAEAEAGEQEQHSKRAVHALHYDAATGLFHAWRSSAARSHPAASAPAAYVSATNVFDRRRGVGRLADVVVLQDELAELVVERAGGQLRVGEAVRLRDGVGVKHRRVDPPARRPIAAGPEAVADDGVAVRLAHDRILRRLRVPLAVEPRDGQIERAPKEMNRAALAQKVAAALLEGPVDASQDPVQPFDRLGVVGGVTTVVGEGRRVRHLDRHGPDVHRQIHLRQRPHHLVIKVRHRRRPQG